MSTRHLAATTLALGLTTIAGCTVTTSSSAAAKSAPVTGAAPATQAQPVIWSVEALQASAKKPDMLDPATKGGRYRAWLMGRSGLNSASLMVQMIAGQRSGAHVHTLSTHYSCALKGTVLLWVEGKIQKVPSGTCYTVPAGLLHDVGADITGDAWFVETTTPLNPTPGFEPVRQDEVRAREKEIAEAFAGAHSR